MPNSILANFAGGETSPKSRGRFDLPWYASSARKLLNFIAEITGPARYRPGFRYVRQTRAGQVARLVRFQLNNSQAYLLEFTDGYMRVYKNRELLTTTTPNITGVTKASPAVVTFDSASGLANGNEMIISGVVGMLELNGRQVKLAGGSGLTFQLVDPVTGANIDSSGFNTYTSGGTAALVYEIVSPYSVSELDSIQYCQDNDVMYLTCSGIEFAYKLTVDSNDGFTLATYTRTNDPFVAGAAINASTPGVTRGTSTLVTFAAGSKIRSGAIYTFASYSGTTQINTGQYKLAVVKGPSYTKPTAYLKDPTTGADIDSSAWSAWTSGGHATPDAEKPIACAFYEGRLFFLGTNQRPNSIFGSRAPNPLTGDNRYDDFTGGSLATDSVFFALAPVNGLVDYVSWARGTTNYLLVGTFGGPFRLSGGGGFGTPISPSSISVQQFDAFGCEATMAAGGSATFYIQRGGTTLRSVKLINLYFGQFESVDMCLNAEHIGNSPLKRVIFQAGRPNMAWVVRSDGVLAGLTVHVSSSGADNVAGWHRHKIGGVNAKVLDAEVIQRPDKDDQLYIVSERLINGVTRRCVEYLADDVVFPDPDDFFTTSAAGQDADDDVWENAAYRLQEQYIHVDSAGTYNGSDRGVAAGATVTPASAALASGVAFTSDVAVFVASDVGKYIWKKPNAATGDGKGQATITAFVSATQVTCTITTAFDSTAGIAPGGWYFAASVIYGLHHLEGARVAVVSDGAVYSDGLEADYPTVTVSAGSIDLSGNQAAVVHAGLPYKGLVETHNLEIGGSQDGPGQAKARNIAEIFIRFLNTLGVDYGTDFYHMNQVDQRPIAAVSGRAAPVYSGIRQLTNTDGWGFEDGTTMRDKHVIVVQRLTVPCIEHFIDVRYDAEGSR